MEYYIREILSGTTNNRFKLCKNATAKFLFYRFNNFWQSFGLSKFQLRHSQISDDDYTLKTLQNKNWAYLTKTLLEVLTNDIRSFSNPNELSILSQLSENLHICKEYHNSVYDNVAGCFQEYLIRSPDLFVGKMEYDININLFSDIDLKNEQDTAEIFKIFDTFFYKFHRFPAVENLDVFPWGSIPSFVKTDDILSPFELYEFFNKTDTHGLVCVEFLAALNSHLGGDKNISKNAMTEFFRKFSLHVHDELDETTNIKFDVINELNKSINNLLMDKADRFINQKNQRLSSNSVNDFKSEIKKIEEDIVDNILNDNWTSAGVWFYPNTADEINKQSEDEKDQKRRLDIVLNERQHETEKRMIFDAKKKSFENFSGNRRRYIKLSCQSVWP